MKIAGLQKLTLLDYPGKTAATVFTYGCNFRCPFCHNAELANGTKLAVLSQHSSLFISEEEFFAFLDKRHGLLDGICITGGEPTLQPDLADFCARIKAKGFLIKLDTNGSNPEVLRALLQENLVDYVAMDIKNSPETYRDTIGLTGDRSHFALKAIEESIDLLLESTIPFEFRTTVVAQLHSAVTMQACAQWIAHHAEKNNYPVQNVAWFLQQFVDSDNVLAGEGHFTSWSEKDFQAVLPHLQALLPKTALRGV